ncbi:hypothetical protein [Lewinella sp. 4G2]|uniref:hypothetical protein n=1 Tax=Lewinella sp. 4G2 TaxID=1803372 RepID=UPI0007B4B1E7|nr:hypothetical protein [Lewinella sp. 4G2]OAV43604.1 hypothetical protein A3850_003430 [Lewinella sp. 4G2]
MLNQNSDPSHLKKISFYILLFATIIIGGNLAYLIALKATAFETQGRIVKWERDDVYVKYRTHLQDSVTVKMNLPYTKDKETLKAYGIIPIRSSTLNLAKVEIEGVKSYGLYTFSTVFIALLVGSTFLAVKLRVIKWSSSTNQD